MPTNTAVSLLVMPPSRLVQWGCMKNLHFIEKIWRYCWVAPEQCVVKLPVNIRGDSLYLSDAMG